MSEGLIGNISRAQITRHMQKVNEQDTGHRAQARFPRGRAQGTCKDATSRAQVYLHSFKELRGRGFIGQRRG